jgi:uncharacterized membrane protein
MIASDLTLSSLDDLTLICVVFVIVGACVVVLSILGIWDLVFRKGNKRK